MTEKPVRDSCSEDPEPLPNNAANREIPYIRKPDPYPVLVGIVLLASIYLLPFFPSPVSGGAALTLADAVGRCPADPGSCSLMLSVTFWLGWGVSLCLILAGIFSRSPDLSWKKD